MHLRDRLIRRVSNTAAARSVVHVLGLIADDQTRQRARDAVRAMRKTPWLVCAVTTGACGDLTSML